jgi:FKBP-type peptidyl-prolyl cis-trans isomerase FklB
MKRRIINTAARGERVVSNCITLKCPLAGPRDRTSYAVGLHVAHGLQNLPFQFNPQTLLAGFRDGLANTQPLLSDLDHRDLFLRFQRELIIQARARLCELSAKSHSTVGAFLPENQNREGIRILPSGLQYRVMVEGVGPVPSMTDVVVVNYRGTLLDGTEFDNSAQHAEPARFKIDQTIPGWTEALCRMKLGAKWQLFVPAELAYGERGAGRLIPPNDMLIYELELAWIEF